MSISMYFGMKIIYQNELEPLNDSYPHPMEFHGETYPDAFHAYMAWNDELLFEHNVEAPDWQAQLDVNRVKFQDPELREVLLNASYEDLHVWTDFGRMLMTIRDEIALEELGSFDEALDAVVPSREMRDYWKEGHFDYRELPNLIAGALIPLEEKAELLETYAPFLALEARKALEALELEPGEVFLVKDGFYLSGQPEEKIENGRLFTDLEAAMGYVAWKFESKGNRDSRPVCRWTILEKWVPGEDDRMELTRSYTLFGTEIIYFSVYTSGGDKYTWGRKDSCDGPSFVDSFYLSLPMPFKVGDCITLDCRPVAPARDVLVLDILEDEVQGTSTLLCLSQEDKKWVITPEWRLKEYAPTVSPLYRMASAGPNDILRAVQAFIHRDAARGKQLRKAMDDMEPMSTEELLALLDKLDKETLNG